MTQLALLLGRPLRMPADDDGSYDDEVDVKYRMNAGWDAARAVTEPSSRRGSRHAFA